MQPVPSYSDFTPPCYQTLLTKHPPGHILAALSHLAAEREAEIRALCSPTGPKDAEEDRYGWNGKVGSTTRSGYDSSEVGLIMSDSTVEGTSLAASKGPYQGVRVPPSAVLPHFRSQVAEKADSSEALPSTLHLIQVNPRPPIQNLIYPFTPKTMPS